MSFENVQVGQFVNKQTNGKEINEFGDSIPT